MKRGWLRAAVGAGVSLVALAGWVAFPRGYGRLPPPAVSWDGPMGTYTYAGAVHLHGEASKDSRTTAGDIIQAARAAGLSFMVLTDHDAVRAAGDAGAHWDQGLLIVSGSEWGTDDGHLLDLSADLGQPPYPRVKDALAACRAHGGPCVAAHPTATRRPFRPALQGVDGVEIHSAFVGLGDLLAPPYVTLFFTGLHILLNPGQALWRQGAFDPAAVELWQAHGGLSTFCGADAHGFLPLKENLLAYLTLVATPETLSPDARVAANQLRSALLHGVCANALAGWVHGLTLRVQGDAVEAQAQVDQTLGPARLVLLKGEVVVGQHALKKSVAATVVSSASAGAWRAQVEVDAPGPWGTVTRTAAVALLHVR